MDDRFGLVVGMVVDYATDLLLYKERGTGARQGTEGGRGYIRWKMW